MASPMMPGTMTFRVAEALYLAGRPMAARAIATSIGQMPSAVHRALCNLMAIELVCLDEAGADGVSLWRLTGDGRATYLSRTAMSTAPASRVVPQTNLPGDVTLLIRGRTRVSAGAELGPRPLRPGALDAKACPRIEGHWRIWPDGRRERIAGEQRKEQQ